MRKKNIMQTVFILVIFALLVVCATLLYNMLVGRYQLDNVINLAEEPGELDTPSDEEDTRILAPDFLVVDAEGEEVRLSDFLGRPVVVNFWASWCPPCKQEMPGFDAVYAEMGEEVVFMMVDLVDGQQETVETGAAYIAEQGYSFPVYYDVSQEAAYLYGISSIPTTLFIDAEGYVVSGAMGVISETNLRRGIEMIRLESA